MFDIKNADEVRALGDSVKQLQLHEYKKLEAAYTMNQLINNSILEGKRECYAPSAIITDDLKQELLDKGYKVENLTVNIGKFISWK